MFAKTSMKEYENGGQDPEKAHKQDVAKPHIPKESASREGGDLVFVLEYFGLFSPDTPKGREPMSFPIAAMDKLDEGLSKRIARAAGVNPEHAEELRGLRASMKRVNMAYQVLAHPILDIADERFANNP